MIHVIAYFLAAQCVLQQRLLLLLLLLLLPLCHLFRHPASPVPTPSHLLPAAVLAEPGLHNEEYDDNFPGEAGNA
jgi:hypothetical protein